MCHVRSVVVHSWYVCTFRKTRHTYKRSCDCEQPLPTLTCLPSMHDSLEMIGRYAGPWRFKAFGVRCHCVANDLSLIIVFYWSGLYFGSIYERYEEWKERWKNENEPTIIRWPTCLCWLQTGESGMLTCFSMGTWTQAIFKCTTIYFLRSKRI